MLTVGEASDLMIVFSSEVFDFTLDLRSEIEVDLFICSLSLGLGGESLDRLELVL